MLTPHTALGSASATFPALFRPVTQLPPGHHPLSPLGRNATQTAPLLSWDATVVDVYHGSRAPNTPVCTCACRNEGRCTHVKTRAGRGDPLAALVPRPVSPCPRHRPSLSTAWIVLWPAPAKLPLNAFIMKTSKHTEKLKEWYSEYPYTHSYYL